MTRLKNLSHIDFEDLCRDIAQLETGKRFSAFGPGADGGVDGRHAVGDGHVILQSKHYAGSTFSNLKTSLKKEVEKLDRLSPKRYLLFTSLSLTRSRANQILEILGKYLLSSDDVFGEEDIEGYLRRNPALEKSHMKLWLTSAGVLERILHSGLEEFTRTTKQEILDDLKVYAKNKSFDEAIEILEKEKILVISGPPGVGKTTLAKMVTYNYLNQGWKFYSIRSLDDGFAKINDESPTIFFFDDFLGRVALNRQALHDQESALAMFVKRVRKSKNARFILTTRAHIFEEARRISDYVDDDRFQLGKYLLDVGRYSRRIKSHILFNHLSVSDLNGQHVKALLEGDHLKKIIDHKNYNPRVISSVSSECFEEIAPQDYPSYILTALDDPKAIWEKPYRALSMKCQNLLTALFFSSEYGEEIETVRTNFRELNKQICAYFGQAYRPDDFEEALKTLESGFVNISGQTVSFVNPAVRDFLRGLFIEDEFLLLLPATARRADSARNIWKQMKTVFEGNKEKLSQCAKEFIEFSLVIGTTPTMKRVNSSRGEAYTRDDISVSDRVRLLFEWWEASGENRFLEVSLELLNSSKLSFGFWNEGTDLPELYWWVDAFVDSEHPYKEELLSSIQKAIWRLVNNGLATDELATVFVAINEFMKEEILPATLERLEEQISYEFEETSSAIEHYSESELSDHLDLLEDLAAKTGRDAEFAKSVVSERLAELEEMHTRYEPSFSHEQRRSEDVFSDQDLRSLIGNLLQK